MLPYVIVAAFLVVTLPSAFAEIDLDVSILDDSILVEFTNTSNMIASGIILWTGGDQILSYAVEPGWRAQVDDTSMRVTGSLSPDQTLRVGLVLNGTKSGLAWQANFGEAQHRDWILEPETDITEPEDVTVNPSGEESLQYIEYGILEMSTLRIIPEKPMAGNPARLVGGSFGMNQDLILSIDGRNISTITTDSSGNFVVTHTIPEHLEDRIDVTLQDSQGRETQISIRLNDTPLTDTASHILSIEPIREPHFRGEPITISGTAEPYSVISATLFDLRDIQVTSIPVFVGQDGQWNWDVLVPLDMPLGEYYISISDGRTTAQTNLTLESTKTILINPTHSTFEKGSSLRFGGTAEPNQDIELILRNPAGNELAYATLYVDITGEVYWEYPTDNNSQGGTYTLVATQGDAVEFAYVGLGTAPVIPVTVLLDRPNYPITETPALTIGGDPNAEISLLVLNPADVIVLEDTITLEPSGRGTYNMDIQNFSTGIYTIILKKGTAQTEQQFGVGLSPATAPPKLQVQEKRIPGDLVLVLGETSPNSIMTISLIDPHGNEVQHDVVFSDRVGMLSSNNIRVPMDAEEGEWSIRIISGSSTLSHPVIVTSATDDTLAGSVREINGSLTIVVTGSTSTYVTITISDGQTDVTGPIRSYITDQGIGQSPWQIEIPGTYIITIDDGSDTVQFTYEHITK